MYNVFFWIFPYLQYKTTTNMHTRTLLLAFLVMSQLLHAQTEGREIPLYPAIVPNSYSLPADEQTDQRPTGGRFIMGTSVPTLTIFRPAKPNGQAVVICPGGGYRGVALDKEGLLVAQELLRDGITAFVLKYRTPSDKHQVDKSLAPLQDAQQAIRFVRQHAAEYQVHPRKVGIMGFSAGGHLAASAGTRFQKSADPNNTDTTSIRPDFLVLIYPVISFSDELVHAGSRTALLGEHPTDADILRCSAEKQVSPDTPPAFLVHAADDKTVPVGNSLAFYKACTDQGILSEMHLYPAGGHGFGLFNTTTPDKWIERLKNWMSTLQ